MIYHVSGEKAERLRDAILSDEVSSKASVVFKDAGILTGERGTYIWVVGTEEQVRRISELLEGEARALEGDELERVLEKLREEDERTLSGFGGLFE